MNRQEAIKHIQHLAGDVASEFSTSTSEDDEIYADANKALMALGVTEEELEDAS